MQKKAQNQFNRYLSNQNSFQSRENQMGITTQKFKYIFKLIGLQNQLNMQLIINANLMNTYLNKSNRLQLKGSSERASTNPSSGKSEEKPRSQKIPPALKSAEIKAKKKVQKFTKKKTSDSEYEPEEWEINNGPIQSKVSETKNVPKNFGKALLGFIKRQTPYVEKVLQKQKVDYKNFQEFIEQCKGKINTIAELRSLWLEENTPFAKTMRILSMHFLRKYSWGHIFNSRVQNYGKHIKYRYKIIEGLQNPIEFTQIKDF